ncbi:TPA: derepression protein [Escherichia coli]
MANRKQHRTIAERRHIQTEINRRLSRAFRVAKIMHINMLHERSCELSNLYSSAVFSYLADVLRELQQLIQQQNKLH